MSPDDPDSRPEGEASPSAEHRDPASAPDAGPSSGAPTPPAERQAPRRSGGGRARRAQLPIGDCFAAAFGIWFRGFFVFTAIVVLITGPYFLITFPPPGIPAEPEPRELSEMVSLLAEQAAGNLVLMLLHQFAAAAVIYGVFRRLKKESAGLVQCIATGLRRLLPVLGVGLLTVLISVLPLVPGGLAMMANPIAGFLLLIPGFVFYLMIYIALLVAPAVVVVERRGVLDSLRRSRDLSKGNRWRVFVVLFVIWLAGGIPIGIAVTAVSTVFMLADPDRMPQALHVVTAVFSFMLYALQAVTVGAIFYHLRVKVEGADEDELAAVFD